MQTTLNPTGGAGAPATVSGEVIATVNGQPITQEILDVYNRQRAAKGIQANPDQPDAALNELIALELMRQ